MTQKVAVAIIHGIGTQGADFAEETQSRIEMICREVCDEDIVIEPVYWANVLQKKEDDLWERMIASGPLDFQMTRHLMVDFVADAIAYQPTAHDRKAYDDIHTEFARTLRSLADHAGEKAPLCIIAHSLGSVIASNFIYDLQKPKLISAEVLAVMGDTPLEWGSTFASLYTLGSPLALWSLRFKEFGQPIAVPSPLLQKFYPTLRGEWINYYDRDDVIAFPLKMLNSEYNRAVTLDVEVNVGSIIASWNPLCHLDYWTDNTVIEPISQALIRMWQTVNP
jgi:hypothetical protein